MASLRSPGWNPVFLRKRIVNFILCALCGENVFFEFMESGKNWIKFVGTAGARFVVAKQLRSSGGLWFSLQGMNLYLDPGPGALVRCLFQQTQA